MNPQKQELLKKLSESQNILVTVSANPSVDQLAACIGLTLLLNKLKKHATAVFSGEVPSTIEFLQPEQTIEKNTDSLRDFIISLDKNKADKLRYKVEDQVVRIFITPYRTSISDKDLDFSQGDFNVDVVLCLGVNDQQDLDQAITSHGRILHDAVVMSINTHPGGELGTINWTEPSASSLSELAAELADVLGKELIDGQIATSMLTGIVAETERFSNEKTSPETMRLSAELMAAGANQQLVASELAAPPVVEEPAPISAPSSDDQTDAQTAEVDEPAEPDAPEEPKDTVAADGTLEISHPALPDNLDDFELPEPIEPENQDYVPLDEPSFDEPEPASEQTDDDIPENEPVADAEPAESEDDGDAPAAEEAVTEPDTSESAPASRMVMQPPSMGGTLTANSTPDQEPLQDALTSQAGTGSQAFLNHPMSDRPANPLLADDGTSPPPADSANPFSGVPIVSPLPADDETLTQLESDVDSPHLDAAPLANVDAARDAVESAINGQAPTTPLPPVQAAGATGYLNVQDLPPSDITGTPVPAEPSAPDLTEAAAQLEVPTQPLPQPLPPSQLTPAASSAPAAAEPQSSAPPVPPPLPLNDLSKFTASNPSQP